MNRFILLFLSLAVFPIHVTAVAEAPSSLGLWQTIDDEAGEAKSLVRISEQDGTLVGRVEKVFPKLGKDPNPLCDKCDGDKQTSPFSA